MLRYYATSVEMHIILPSLIKIYTERKSEGENEAGMRSRKPVREADSYLVLGGVLIILITLLYAIYMAK